MSHSDEISLKGKRVLVSGGTTGIGRAIVDLLVEEGAHVAAFARKAEDINELSTAQPTVLAFTADTSKHEDVKAAFDRATKEFGGLDLVVTNAGISGDSVLQQPFSEWRYVLEVNLMGPMLMTTMAGERLEGGGRVIAIGSISAKVRGEESDVYVATKTGLRGFVDSVSKMLNPKGIGVSLIEPGLTQSEMVRHGRSDEELDEEIEKMKMLAAEDIARTVLFVARQPARVEIPFMQVRPIGEPE
ncbi:MAG TPA: SDR family oxidoreductase [Fimbriimonas sp.]|nr:SDR family oxidoreductase [Fimbriimonas sp.]